MKTTRWIVTALLALGWGCSEPAGNEPGAAQDVASTTDAPDSLGETVADIPPADAPEEDGAQPSPDALADTGDGGAQTDANTGSDDAQDAVWDGAEDVIEDVPQELPSSDDATEDTAPPSPTITPDNSLCSEPGGDRNIYDIQNPECPDHFNPNPVGNPGVNLTLSGVVVTAVFNDTIFVQEPQGGPYSGIAVFMHGLFTGDLQLGDVLDLEGNYSEFFDNTQIYMVSWTVTGSQSPPEPYLIEYPEWIATDGPLAEMFEGVLVRVANVETVNTMPDCPQEYGEFMVTGDLRVDDKGVYWEARLGDLFASVTGPLLYGFGNFKLLPRTEVDLDWTAKGGASALTKCIPNECQEPEENLGTQEILITEAMPDPFGSDWGQEWFELYNPNSYSVDVEGWEIRDCGDQKLVIGSGNTTIFPGAYMVLGQTIDPAVNGGAGVNYPYGPDFYMPNTVGSILLYRPGANPNLPTLVDQVRLSAFEPLLNISLGVSAERIDPTGSGSDPANWALGVETYGSTENMGTPGAKNTATD